MIGGYTSSITGTKTTHLYSGLPSGYYGVIFTTDTTATVGVSYQSDSYTCPFNSVFSDVNAVFSGCTSSSVSSQYTVGPPCFANEPGTLKCTGCYAGSTLDNGKCLFNTSCGSRQYFHFGQCYDVNPDCDKFDHFTGACYTCLSENKEVKDRICVDKTNCPTGEYAVSGSCIPNNCS